MLTLKFNDTNDHAEHDWLVLDRDIFVAGFASSNAATRFIDERQNEARMAAKIFAECRARRAAREATRDPITKRLP